MGKGLKTAFTQLGNQYGKPDTERLGLFSEMPYMNGKGYVSPFPRIKHDKGKRMLGEGSKIKCGKQDCYFDKEPFKRLFTGEAIAGRGRKPKPPSFKNVSERPMIPTGETKKHSTPGDYYGTFGKIEAFSNQRRPKPPYKKQEINFLSGPGKKGGPGYPNICLNPYPEHKPDRYGLKPKYKEYGHQLGGPFVSAHYPTPYFEANPFADPPKIKPGPVYVRPKEKLVEPLPPGILMPTGPAKWQGGCHAGCFDKYPEHKPDKYLSIYQVLKPTKRTLLNGEFFPQSTALKSFYTYSIVNENIDFRVNTSNCNTYEPQYIKYLVN